MLKLFEDVARKIAVTLMALSLIVAANSSALMGHADAAPTSCDETSQAGGKVEGQAWKGAFDAAAFSTFIKAGDLSKNTKGSDNNVVDNGCCALFCSPTVAVPSQAEPLIPPATAVVWESPSKSLSPVFQDGLKRPPRQSGSI
jgi:uncharacterized membrane protein